VARSRTFAGRITEHSFDDAIFARVVGENGAASVGSKERKRLPQGVLEDLELAVDLDTNRLKRLASRMATGTTGRRRNGVANDLRQLRSGGDRTSRDECAGDARCMTLITVSAKDRGQVALVRSVDKIRCGSTTAAVHSHVEGPIVAEAEPTVGVVELWRADPKIEQAARDPIDTDAPHGVGDPVETGVAQPHPFTVGREASACESRSHLCPALRVINVKNNRMS